MAFQFHGMGADDDGLFYKARQPQNAWDCVAWLTPAGLQVQRGRTGTPTCLAWDDGRSVPWRIPYSGSAAAMPARTGDQVWWIDAQTGTQSTPSIRRGTPTGWRSVRGYTDRWMLSRFLVRRDATVLDALCQYLSRTPAARLGLAGAVRCADVIRALASDNLNGPAAGAAPLRPSKGYTYEVTVRVVNTRARLFRGRPVAGEPLPTHADVVAEVIASLPPGGPEGWKDRDLIGGYAERLLSAKPWPFSLLIAEAPPGPTAL
jgi:hypothetical protein